MTTITKRKKRIGPKVKKAAKVLPSTSGVIGNDDGFDSPAWQGTLFWYSVSAYNFISGNDFDVVKGVVDAANEFNQHEPLHMPRKDGSFAKTVLPILGERSGPYLIALMGSFLVWTQMHLANNELPDSPLLKACEAGYNFWKLDVAKQSENAR